MADEENNTNGGLAGLAALTDDDRDEAAEDSLTPGKALLGAHIITLPSVESTPSVRPRSRSALQEIEDKLENKAKREIGKNFDKNVLKRLWNKFFGKAEEEVAEKVGVEAAEGAAEGAAETGVVAATETAAVGVAETGIGAAVVAAAPEIIIGAAVVGTVAVGYASIRNGIAQSKLDDATKHIAEGVTVESNHDLTRYQSLRGTLIQLLPEIPDTSVMSKNLHMDGDNVIVDDKGHRLDMTDQRNRDALRNILEAKIREQETVIQAHRSGWTNWIPDALYLGSDRGVEKEARAKQAPYIAALEQLKRYEAEVKGHGPATPTAEATTRANAANGSAPAPQQNAPARHQETPGPATGKTVVLGDSIAFGCGQECDGEVLNFAVPSSHMNTVSINVKHEITNKDGTKSTITEKKTLKGAQEQLDEVMNLNLGKGDKILVHTGRNDIDLVGSPAYREKLEAMARHLQFLQSQGLQIVWVAPIAGGDRDAAKVQKMADLQKEVGEKYGIKVKTTDKTYERAAGTEKNPDDVHPVDYHQVTSDVTAGTGIPVKPPRSPHPQIPSHKANPNYSNMTPTIAMVAREKQAMDYFISEGWTREQSAAIVGNLMRESGFNHQLSGDYNKKTGAYDAKGIGQWHKPRQDQFAAVFGHSIDTATYEENLQFVNYELKKGAYKQVGDKLAKEATLAGATHLLRKDYESPADKDGQEDTIRGGYAQEAYNRSLQRADVRMAAGNQTPRPAAGARDRLPSGPAVAVLEPQPQHPPGNKPNAHGEEAHPVA
jgi:hypothetical protein